MIISKMSKIILMHHLFILDEWGFLPSFPLSLSLQHSRNLVNSIFLKKLPRNYEFLRVWQVVLLLLFTWQSDLLSLRPEPMSIF